MATADEYAAWIVANPGKRGTPEFATVVQAYELAKADERAAQPAPAAAAVPAPPSVGQRVVGVGEAALTAVTGATGGTIGMIGGTLQGLAREILAGRFGTPEAMRAIEASAMQGMQAGTYEPRTQAGRETLQAIGEATAPLAPLMGVAPMLNVPVQAAAAARQAMPAVQAAGGRAATSAQAAAQRTVVEPAQRATAAVRESLGMKPAAPAAPLRPGSAGAAATPAVQQRIATAEALPVPVKLTRGAATRESEDLAFEKEKVKSPTLGAPLRARAEENNLQLLQNLDAFLDATEAQTPMVGPAATGNAVLRSLNEGLDAAKNRVRVAYKRAEESPEATAPVDASALVSHLNAQPTGLPTTAIPDTVRQYAIRLGVASQDENGQLVPLSTDVATMERLRKELNAKTGFDPVDVREATLLKGIIDAATEPVSGPLFREARRLRQIQAQRYEDRAIVYRLLNDRQGFADPLVAVDQVFNRSILNGSPADITRLKRVLLTGGRGAPNQAEIRANGVQAWRELQGATVQHIRDEATKNLGMDSAGNPLVSPAKLHQTVQSLDKNGRLDIILGKQQAQLVRDLDEVSRYVSTVPPGTLVNTSDTAGAVMAAIAEAVATGAITGMPLPAASLLRAATGKMRDNRIKARINRALTPTD